MNRIFHCSLVAGLLMLALLFAASSAAQSAPEAPDEAMLTGAELLESCETPGYAEQPTPFCMEFTFGLVQTVAMLQELTPDDRIFCIDPEQISLESVTSNVTDWLQAHPERLEEPAFLLVSEALGEHYPCSPPGTEIL